MKKKKTIKTKKTIELGEIDKTDGFRTQKFKKFKKHHEIIEKINEENLRVVNSLPAPPEPEDILKKTYAMVALALEENQKILISNAKPRYKLGAIKVAVYSFIEISKLKLNIDDKEEKKEERAEIEKKLLEIISNKKKA